MKLKQWMKVILVGTSILTLAACSAHRKHDGTAITEANAAYNDSGAQANGLGDESRFGDQGGLNTKHLAKRIYYFDYDSNIVHTEDVPPIHSNASYLTAHNSSKVMLEGHTDPRGSREYNIGLGERRAKAVAELMTEKGTNPNQIRVVSYGAEKLASSARSETAYQKDRRVVLVYLQR